jgi:hypothetical protein
MHFKITYDSGESSFAYEINSSDGDLDAIFIGIKSFITTITDVDEEEFDPDDDEPM